MKNYMNKSFSERERIERYAVNREKEDFKREELECELRHENEFSNNNKYKSV